MIALLLSGCTLVGLGAGGLYATSKNGDPQVEMGHQPRTSLGKSIAVGGAIGLTLDIAFAALALSTGNGPGH